VVTWVAAPVLVLLAGLLTGADPLLSMPEWGSGPGGATEITVELPEEAAATAAPSEPPSAEAQMRGPSGEPLRCVTEGCIAWQAELSGASQPILVLAEAGRIVVFQEPTVQADGGIGEPSGGGGPLGVLTVVDAATGVIGWQRSMAFPGGHLGAAGVAAVDEQLLVVDRPGTLSAFARDDGALEWAVTVDGAVTVGQARRIGADLLVVVETGDSAAQDSAAQDSAAQDSAAQVSGAKVVALDPATGLARWSSPTARRVVLTSAGPVLFDPFDRMRGLDPVDGSERWSKPLRAIPQMLLSVDGLVVLDRGRTSVIDAVDGRVVTELAGRPAPPAFPFPPHDEAGLIVLGGSGIGYLGGDGATWTTVLPGCCSDGSLDGDRVWVWLEDGSVRQLDREDGRELPPAPPGTPREVERDRGVVALAGGYLFALEGNQRAREFSIEETWAGRTLARFGSGTPLGLADGGALLFGEPGAGPGSPARLSALRTPRAPTAEATS